MMRDVADMHQEATRRSLDIRQSQATEGIADTALL
jgi:hypothetical protein